jgi:hypothetical protein
MTAYRAAELLVKVLAVQLIAIGVITFASDVVGRMLEADNGVWVRSSFPPMVLAGLYVLAGVIGLYASGALSRLLVRQSDVAAGGGH